jgi:hypothetical protein
MLIVIAKIISSLGGAYVLYTLLMSLNSIASGEYAVTLVSSWGLTMISLTIYESRIWRQ